MFDMQQTLNETARKLRDMPNKDREWVKVLIDHLD